MKDFSNIVALGAGRMGRGIAHMFAYAGHKVILLDIKDRAEVDFRKLEQEAYEEIRSNMGLLTTLNVMTSEQTEKALGLITVCSNSDTEAVLAKADIIIEGVPERIEAKKHALQRISNHARKDTVVASTTSTMLVSELQKEISHPQRFVNTHFLNPAFLIPLVEVSPGLDTEEEVVESVMNLFRSIGKQPVRCAASPGYIIPRLQSLIIAEACRMVDEGVVTAEDLDKAIKYGFGPRFASMGIMEFADWGGIDTVYFAGHQLAQALDSPSHAPPEEVSRMMEEGRTGLRAGQGYYDYREMDVVAWQKEKLSRFVNLLRDLDQIPSAGV
ncbi:MAG: 3-hydroxybutyryl-CoA dehydrogenase [Planctomycetota bacterium]|jgi:3-hydroxybutyryl-CoA dehydrogenase